MSDGTIVLLIAGAYLGASLLVGVLPGRKTSDSAEGFVAGDRALGGVVMYFITGATIFSAFAFLGAPGWAYSRGGASIYILAYGILGFVPFYVLGPRAARLGKRFGFVTQAEMVAARFGRPGIAVLMALITTLALVPYLAIQMGGAGMVLAEMTELGAFTSDNAAMSARHQNPAMFRGSVGQEGVAEGHVWLHEPRVLVTNPIADDPEKELERLTEAV